MIEKMQFMDNTIDKTDTVFSLKMFFPMVNVLVYYTNESLYAVKRKKYCLHIYVFYTLNIR